MQPMQPRKKQVKQCSWCFSGTSPFSPRDKPKYAASPSPASRHRMGFAACGDTEGLRERTVEPQGVHVPGTCVPDTPCMAYLHTLTPKTTPMYANMPYMECLGVVWGQTMSPGDSGSSGRQSVFGQPTVFHVLILTSQSRLCPFLVLK